MAKTVVGVEVKVDGKQAEQSVGSFKKQLREANNEVVSLTEKFGATSREAIAAAQKVAKLKDAIGDAKALSDAFSPDAKFNAFAGAIQGAVSGFSALQGAQALFGTESEELNKTLLKVQAALALSQGLNGILAAKDAFVNLSAVIKAQVLTAFGTLRAAIISTGIGALVVGIGLLITNFEKVKKAIIGAIPGAETFFNVIGDVVDTVKGWFGANEDVLDTQKALKDATNDLSSALSEYNAEIDRTTKLEKLRAQIAGKSQAEINKLDEDNINQKIRRNDRLIELARQYGISTVTLEADRQKLLQDLETKSLENQAAAVTASRQKKQKEDDDFFKKDLEKIKERNILQNAERLDGQRGVIDETKSVLSGITQATKDANAQQIEDERNRAASITAIRQDQLKEIIASDEAERQSRLQTLEIVATATESFANLVGKQTAAGKALAIAAATINTYKAASEALKADYGTFGPAAQVARVLTVASVIATGLKQVREIAKVKVPGGGGGGSVPSATSVQPITPVNQTTQLDQNSINQIGNAAGRAFVLETDVTNNQERIRRLNRAARIN